MSFPVQVEYPDGTAADFDAPAGLSVLVAAMRSGVYLRHDCGGKAQCGTCRVSLAEGRLGPKEGRESELLARVQADGGERLACQARPMSAVRLLARNPKPLRQEGN